MQFPKLLSFSNALNGMKRRQSGYNLQTTGMLPTFGKSAAASPAAGSSGAVSLASTVLDSVFARLKQAGAVAKRVLLKPEEPQPFAAETEKKSYQVFRRLSAQDEVRHVAPPTPSWGEPTADALTDNQELGRNIKPTLFEKIAKIWKREVPQGVELIAAAPVSASVATEVSTVEAPVQVENAFAATCPGKRDKNLIADAYEQRMAEKKVATPVAVVAPVAVVKVHSAAKPEVKQSVPSKFRDAIFGRGKRKAAQPVVQGELALDSVRPIRNDLSDADLEVVSGVAMVGTGKLQTATTEKATSTAATSRRVITQKTDSAINSTAELPAEPAQAPELIARV
jgi:hypothetical protein